MILKFKLFIKKILLFFLDAGYKIENVEMFGNSYGLKNVTFEGKNSIADRCNFGGTIKIGYATTLGMNNFFHGDITIGKYCQVGGDVAIHGSNHPVSFLTTYINKNLFKGELYALKQHNKIIIGNDVWIGHNVIIVGNVTIGNGAILAAGAVVNKDVAPYTIVGGVPAKEIKIRFSDNIIQEIEALNWWDLSDDELEKIKPIFFKDFTNLTSIYD